MTKQGLSPNGPHPTRTPNPRRRLSSPLPAPPASHQPNCLLSIPETHPKPELRKRSRPSYAKRTHSLHQIISWARHHDSTTFVLRAPDALSITRIQACSFPCLRVPVLLRSTSLYQLSDHSGHVVVVHHVMACVQLAIYLSIHPSIRSSTASLSVFTTECIMYYHISISSPHPLP
jgi:hypothetical protein